MLHPPPSSPRNRRGFSFVEVLLALVILSVVSGVLYLSFHSGALEGKMAEDRVKALAIAQREIERVKQIAALGRGSLDQFWSDPARRTRRYEVDGCYAVVVSVDPRRTVTVAGSSAEVGEAVVAVSWSRPGRPDQIVQLTTLVDQAYY